jgi:type IV secretion system protein VirB1
VTALSPAAVLALAAQWGSPVAPGAILAQARVESSLDPLAIHDDTTGRNYRPSTEGAAMRIALRLEAAGHDIDVGIMQINCRNFGWLHLSLASAFDPVQSIRAAATVLVSYSRYNTGGLGGLSNGYVQKVLSVGRYSGFTPFEDRPIPLVAASGNAVAAGDVPAASSDDLEDGAIHPGVQSDVTVSSAMSTLPPTNPSLETHSEVLRDGAIHPDVSGTATDAGHG